MSANDRNDFSYHPRVVSREPASDTTDDWQGFAVIVIVLVFYLTEMWWASVGVWGT